MTRNAIKGDDYRKAGSILLYEVDYLDGAQGELCNETNLIKFGVNATGKQKYSCKNSNFKKSTFLLDYSRNGDLPKVKQKIIEMALNGSGIRDTARVLGISQNTGMSEF